MTVLMKNKKGVSNEHVWWIALYIRYTRIVFCVCVFDEEKLSVSDGFSLLCEPRRHQKPQMNVSKTTRVMVRVCYSRTDFPRLRIVRFNQSIFITHCRAFLFGQSRVMYLTFSEIISPAKVWMCMSLIDYSKLTGKIEYYKTRKLRYPQSTHSSRKTNNT